MRQLSIFPSRVRTSAQLLGIAESVPALLVPVAVKHGHQIEQIAATQGIVNEVHLVACPQRHRLPAQVLRHFRRGQYGTIGDVAGNHRLSIIDDKRTDR
jgi:hypothetical protein